MKGLRVIEITDYEANGAKSGIGIGDTLIQINNTFFRSVDELVKIIKNQFDDNMNEIAYYDKQGSLKIASVTTGKLGLSLIPVEIEENTPDKLNKLHDKICNLININKVLVSTKSNIDGYFSVNHFGIVGVTNEFDASIFERVANLVDDARTVAVTKLKRKGYKLGANAIVSVTFDYRVWGSGGFIFATGTAIKVEKSNQPIN